MGQALRRWELGFNICRISIMVEFRITKTFLVHSQPPKSPTPLTRGEDKRGSSPLPLPSYQRGSGGLWKLRAGRSYW